jgi:hypothetical protein
MMLKLNVFFDLLVDDIFNFGKFLLAHL